jgi:hypothetical protein
MTARDELGHVGVPSGTTLARRQRRNPLRTASSKGPLPGQPCLKLIDDDYFCRSATITFAGSGRPDGA